MEAQEFCRFVWHIYLEKKDYQALENLLAPDLSVIGTGAMNSAGTGNRPCVS